MTFTIPTYRNPLYRPPNRRPWTFSSRILKIVKFQFENKSLVLSHSRIFILNTSISGNGIRGLLFACGITFSYHLACLLLDANSSAQSLNYCVPHLCNIISFCKVRQMSLILINLLNVNACHSHSQRDLHSQIERTSSRMSVERRSAESPHPT